MTWSAKLKVCDYMQSRVSAAAAPMLMEKPPQDQEMPSTYGRPGASGVGRSAGRLPLTGEIIFELSDCRWLHRAGYE